MEKFEGCKFRPTGKVIITHDPYTNELKYKDEFVPTKGYMIYLEQKYILELELELKRLKTRLDYETKEYGECDQIEFKRYLSLLDKVYSLTNKPKTHFAKSGKSQPMKFEMAPQPYLPKPNSR